MYKTTSGWIHFKASKQFLLVIGKMIYGLFYKLSYLCCNNTSHNK